MSDDREINRAKLWVEGRKSKDGQHEGDDLKEKVAKIDEYISIKKSGSSMSTQIEGTILDSALQKKEHCGFLRGVGGHTYKTSYFKVGKGKKASKTQQSDLSDVKKRSADQDARLTKLEEIVFKKSRLEDLSSLKGSCSVHQSEKKDDSGQSPDHANEDDIEMLDDEAVKRAQYLGKLVELTLESNNDVVAYGTIIKVHGPNELFDANYMQVTIDEALNEDAALPVPTDDCPSIGDGVGSHVMWPVRLLKMKDEKPQKKKNLEKAGPSIDLTNVPKPLRVVYWFCKASLQRTGTIAIRVDDDLFGHERTVYVHLQDVEPFCQLSPISYTCIVVYTWFLFKKMKLLNKVDKFRFVDPYNIGHIPSTKNDKKSRNERLESRSRNLAERLVGTLPNQIVLAPVNVGLIAYLRPNKYARLIPPQYLLA